MLLLPVLIRSIPTSISWSRWPKWAILPPFSTTWPISIHIVLTVISPIPPLIRACDIERIDIPLMISCSIIVSPVIIAIISEVNERVNPAQKPLAGELNHHAGQLAGELNHHIGQLAGELNHHAGQLAGELNRRVVALARRAQPSRRSARRRGELSCGCARRRVRPSRESACPASST
ncbi:hypothetical protein F2Q68_00024573 [Brassica cretica]|uniref:Uncharacterized protein n=1 Tax=Brassica cretica TaxID=69181 RepID=A0A8S9IG96_BRACR|nr:hypothetical protein F2Q68_00024573 [Brassica cretica]